MAVEWKKLAFEEDVATLSDATPESVGTAAAAGTGTDASRDDHVHDLGADCIDSGDLIADDVIDSEHIVDGAIDTAHLAADVVDATKLADDAVGSEHIEQLSAALDFGGQEATDLVLHNSATDPGTPVVGKIYYKTGDTHPYICTSAA